jgi:hypothetical protein
MNSVRRSLTCLFLLPLFALAQPAERNGPRAYIQVEGGAVSGAEISDDASRNFGDLDVTQFGVTVGQSLSVAPRTGLNLALEYQRFDLDIDERWVPLPEQVQSFAFKATVRHPMTERWVLLAGLEAGFASADDPFESGGFGLKASVLGLYQQSETLTWAVGLIYRSLAEDDLRVLPAVGLDWRPNAQWNVVVGFPRTMITYIVRPGFRTWFGVSAQGGTFYLKKGVGSLLSSLRPLNDTLLDYTEIRVGPGVEYRPTPNLELSAMVGVIVHQSFDYFERDYEIEADNATPFVGVGAKYSF